MPFFSQQSRRKLATCHPDLQRLFAEVIKWYDCTVICGHRGEQEQNAAFESGHSKVKWPDGKHNKLPSLAVDVVPYPINWGNTRRMYYFGGYVCATARQMGLPLRWGGDWDNDTMINDQTFNDLVHFELEER